MQMEDGHSSCRQGQGRLVREPHWQKHIVVNHLTKRDHVCLTARDLDGDGRAELAMGESGTPEIRFRVVRFFIFLPTNRAKEFGVITPSP